jgi:hypothetical protein
MSASSEFDRPVRLRVACLSLRHKMMYVDERHAVRGMVDDSSDTRIYWCTKTQEALGPDGKPVSPGDCETGRECYCRNG